MADRKQLKILKKQDVTAWNLWREDNEQRPNLTGADLRLAKLAGANLKHAVLADADLTMVNLTGADLRGAHLVRRPTAWTAKRMPKSSMR